jgi:uncharacterized membrane protein YraQ (UPF0718 family)
MILFIIILMSVVILLMGYIIRNLLLKNEKQEDILTEYMKYLNKISLTIETASEKLKEVDSREIFKSDDEVGFIFEQIKIIQEVLNVFIIKELETNDPNQKIQKT